MSFKYFIFFIILNILLVSCYTYFKAPPPALDEGFIRSINYYKEGEKISSKLKINGYYNDISKVNRYNNELLLKDKYGTLNKLASIKIFFDNGFVFNKGASRSEYISKRSYVGNRNTMYSRNNWGVFYIEGDKIVAKIYVDFYNNHSARNKYILCHYEGKILNDTTIADWHLVRPYPVYDEKFNYNFIEEETKPSELRFIAGPDSFKTQYADSSKAWINYYFGNKNIKLK